jgi:hypothetical protein
MGARHQSVSDARNGPRPENIAEGVGWAGRGRSFAFALTAWTIIGLTLGVSTNILQGVLPDRWQHLANSGAVWVVAAFVAGAWYRKPPVKPPVLGVATQVGAVVGYYGYAQLLRGGAGSLNAPFVWFLFAVFAGWLFASAGARWRAEGRASRVLAGALLGAAFLMEGLWILWRLDAAALGWTFLAVGGLVPLLIGRSIKERIYGALAVVPLGIVAVGFFAVVLTVVGLN